MATIDSYSFTNPSWALHQHLFDAIKKWSGTEAIGYAKIYKFQAPNEESNSVELDIIGSRQDAIGKPSFTTDIAVRYTTPDRFVYDEELSEGTEDGFKEFGEEWAVLTFLVCKITEAARKNDFKYVSIGTLAENNGSVEPDGARVTMVETLPFRSVWKKAVAKA
jgi:hypothetical protein